MNDEVSVAELLEREGWTEADPAAPKGRMQVVAVMLAVVLGCGLAALLVHFGSQNPQADSPSLIDLPHGPTGGLAGGGVPSILDTTEVTGTNTRLVVTNQSGTAGNGVPENTRHRTTGTSTITVTETGKPSASTTGSGAAVTTTDTSGPGVPTSTGTRKTTTTTTPAPTTCFLLFCW
ncbi:hypothetical protein ORV05_00670 [Amycolatopsis cynarae]|uniref:Uncharacterized protein n=1 Tax=Amycolatopsis cynarae TaxID=2995223 RepID=A0ABY7B6G9_9PSEU|nr:hypothetical protein [Amycolatopsis sp. HUAS 11-8]WAL66368.1 hypothetical protein ORV05_00670 [Amycolatopsis sp. HUAS 11-8]